MTFRYKDYRRSGSQRHQIMTLAAHEFMRRFLLHVLPHGFHRIRHYGFGGARGCIQRSKVSMMRIRPPQQGQGGNRSGGSSVTMASGGGATASSSRTRAMLALRVALANNVGFDIRRRHQPRVMP